MVTFNQLWSNHPTIAGNDHPCATRGKGNFPNQCSIRLGVALAVSGVKTERIPGAVHCWYHDRSEGHIIRAEQLANGLNKYPIPGIWKVIKVPSESFPEKLSGKTGIMFFKDYWRREFTDKNGKKKIQAFRNRSGDHIDLWNGSRLTELSSWFRIHLRIGSYGLHSLSDEWSDYEDAKGIWFWRVL